MAAASLALLGMVLFPGLLLVWAVAAVAVGGIGAAGAHVLRPAAGTAVGIGVLTAATTMALGLAVAGSIVLVGVAMVWVVPLLLGLGGLLRWRYRRSWIAAFDDLIRPKPVAGSPTNPSHTGGHTRGHSTTETQGADRGEPALLVPRLLAQLPSLKPGAVSTLRLCGAWQRSYWLLLDMPPGPSRDEVVRIRRHVLDELERRDPTGFGRWLQTEPRAGSHPGQYLITDN